MKRLTTNKSTFSFNTFFFNKRLNNNNKTKNRIIFVYQNFPIFFVLDFENDPKSSSAELLVYFVFDLEDGSFLEFDDPVFEWSVESWIVFELVPTFVVLLILVVLIKRISKL